jgi:hypothetical protein
MPHLTQEQIDEWTNLKGDFSTSPTYIDLVTGIWHAVTWYYKPSMWSDYRFPQSFIEDFMRHFYFPLNQIYYIVYIAIVITIARYLFERFVCKVSEPAEFDR